MNLGEHIKTVSHTVINLTTPKIIPYVGFSVINKNLNLTLKRLTQNNLVKLLRLINLMAIQRKSIYYSIPMAWTT